MGKVILKVLTAICILFILPVMLNGAKVGVLRFKGINVINETASAVSELLVSELATYGHQVLNPDALDAAVGEKISCYEATCAAEAGFKAKVERMIFGSISKFGEKYVVQVTVVSVATSEVLWTGSASSKTAEDMDTVIKRIAKAIAEGKKVDEGAEVGMITEQEITTESRRKEGFYSTGGGFIFGFPMGGYAGANSLMGFAWLNCFETKNFMIQVNMPYLWSLGAQAIGSGTEPSVLDYGLLDFEFDYLFSKSDIAPYAGGGLGMHMLILSRSGFNTETNFGMVFSGGGGLIFMRTYDFHVIINAGYSVNIADLPSYEIPHHGFKIGLGVVYRPRGGCGGGGFGGGGCGRGCM
ncbi:MAG TPA: hypothetical protein VF399_00045 [bacterium]